MMACKNTPWTGLTRMFRKHIMSQEAKLIWIQEGCLLSSVSIRDVCLLKGWLRWRTVHRLGRNTSLSGQVIREGLNESDSKHVSIERERGGENFIKQFVTVVKNILKPMHSQCYENLWREIMKRVIYFWIHSGHFLLLSIFPFLLSLLFIALLTLNTISPFKIWPLLTNQDLL